MSRASQRLPRTDKFRAGNRLTRWLFALAGLAALSGCIFQPPLFFKAEIRAMRTEAAQRFPLGSSAAEFEAWFASKGGEEWRIVPIKGTVPTARGKDLMLPRFNPKKGCEIHKMLLSRVEGCMNTFTADYCVNDAGKLMSLKFTEGGYC